MYKLYVLQNYVCLGFLVFKCLTWWTYFQKSVRLIPDDATAILSQRILLAGVTELAVRVVLETLLSSPVKLL